mmetsp:Transcript_46392/g.130653  ORF Transcript_46392/g.130653 Transcript_46392/m.130653 type:complete len:222 (-) Transcript_46392:781-1446(-)
MWPLLATISSEHLLPIPRHPMPPCHHPLLCSLSNLQIHGVRLPGMGLHQQQLPQCLGVILRRLPPVMIMVLQHLHLPRMELLPKIHLGLLLLLLLNNKLCRLLPPWPRMALHPHRLPPRLTLMAPRLHRPPLPRTPMAPRLRCNNSKQPTNSSQRTANNQCTDSPQLRNIRIHMARLLKKLYPLVSITLPLLVLDLHRHLVRMLRNQPPLTHSLISLRTLL